LEVDQKYVAGFEVWCWRRMEKIGWTDHVINGGILRTVKEERNSQRIYSKKEGG
jgi:hypothetical protein